MISGVPGEEMLLRLEAEAERAEVKREEIARQAEEAIERKAREERAAQDALRPAFYEAVEAAAPLLEAFLGAPDCDRLLTAWARIWGMVPPSGVTLPALYLHGNPRGDRINLRAVFKDEVWAASPYTGGIYSWTVGKRLTLTRRIHRMQPPELVFQSDHGLLRLLAWYEGRFDEKAVPVVLRLCQLIRDRRLLSILASEGALPVWDH